VTRRSVIGVRRRGRTAVVVGHDALMVLNYGNIRYRRDRHGWAIPIEAVPDVEAAAQVLGVIVSLGMPS